MKNLPNIEKHPTHRREYIGYGNGVWRIAKKDGLWHAVRERPRRGYMTAETLEELSIDLEKRERGKQ